MKSEVFCKFVLISVFLGGCHCSLPSGRINKAKSQDNLIQSLKRAIIADGPNAAERLIGYRADYNTERNPEDHLIVKLSWRENVEFYGHPFDILSARDFVLWQGKMDKSYRFEVSGICWLKNGGTRLITMKMGAWGGRFQ